MRRDYWYLIIITFLLFIIGYVGRVTGYSHSLLVSYNIKRREANHIDYHQKEVSVMQRSVERSWENCLRQMDTHYDVAFYGNSITRNGNFSSYFPNTSICNLGHGGDDLDGMRRRIGMASCLSPKIVFLMAGINDQADNIPIDIFQIKYRELIKCFTDSLPNTKIYIQSILPVNSKVYDIFGTNAHIDSCNQIIKNIAKEFNLDYIDLYSLYIEEGELPLSYTKGSDGLHLSPERYDIWINRIKPIIDSLSCNSIP